MSATDTLVLTRTIQGHQVPEAGTYALDASHSHVGFSVRHVMVSKTKGRFGDVAGTITIGEDPFESSVEVEIQMASVDTRDETRDGHLRSADFFDVEQFPTMTYRSTKVSSDGNRWTVDGDLTVKGITRSVPLELEFEGGAKDPWGGTRIGFTARTELNREDFGLSWNQTLETGGVLVGKQVKIDLEVEAVRQ
jgi:polyisoprenoid-binding protein YceI